MPEKPTPPDDGRTPEERQMDKALKATFPASDPPAFSSGTATPQSGDRETPNTHRGEQAGGDDEERTG